MTLCKMEGGGSANCGAGEVSSMLHGCDMGVLHAAAYGDRAKAITRIAEERKLGKRLVRGHPMIEAEVVYAVNHEYCEHPDDFIARRTRLAFLDVAATEQALPRVGLPSCHQLVQGFLTALLFRSASSS